MGKTIKANIDLYLTALVQMLLLSPTLILSFFMRMWVLVGFTPFINAFIIYVSFRICSKICRPKVLIIIYLVTLLVFAIAAACLGAHSYSEGVPDWELGVCVVLLFHFWCYTLPYLFGVIYSCFNHKAAKRENANM